MAKISYELTALDRHFAAFIRREAAHAPACLELVAALVSHAVGNGNICLNLSECAAAELTLDDHDYQLPELKEMLEQLAASGVVGFPGEFKPLVLDADGRLYLYRYWKYESDLARIIQDKSAIPVCDLDENLLARAVRRLFPVTADDGIDWQQVAALAALKKKFCVISGGPGTGKTSTVVKILALLLEQAPGSRLRIALAAPTGKAAARLKESIRRMKDALECSAGIKAQIPEDVTTIHRLLGVRSGSVRFRHTADNQLPHDVVIIDEASMVALPLMAKLVVAIRNDARLILLGDRDQLASVEAGAVLGDICGTGRSTRYSQGFADFVSRVTGYTVADRADCGDSGHLSDALVVLQRTYRFGADSSIGAISRAVNAGEGRQACAILKDESCSGSRWQVIPRPDRLKNALAEIIVTGYGRYLSAGSPVEALRLFDSFRILCALRQGPYGVSGMNALVEDVLAAKGLIDHHTRWYPGRPVMITVNDYTMKLFNGDIGIVMPDPEHDDTPRVWFPAVEGGVRSVSPVRVPAHETVYAMTVHKSQGSEFERVLLLLPDHDSDALARELIYTGITRAKQDVEVWADEEVFVAAVSRRVDRKSGLAAALWGDVT
ncbi:MAG TPA: exodeoxyribonuclease V subunit alpha [Desulfuromonadales bacterium]|nr:exodeoxyribonuclease V subunit alpha [Desulfuromonadales bacterium]